MKAASLAHRLTAIERRYQPPAEWPLAWDHVPKVATAAEWEALARQPADDDAGMPSGVVWAPQAGPQALLLSAALYGLVDLIYYGGARGGGKTDGALGLALHHVKLHGQAAKILVLRRTLDELTQIIDRSKEIFGAIPGAEWHASSKTWTIDGATIRFRYLDRDEDASHFQGHGYTLILIEEVGNFPSSTPIFMLLGALRSGVGAKCCIVMTGNPGGAGQSWLKSVFVDRAPHGNKIFTMVAETGHVLRCLYVPSRLEDNRILMANDPGYEGRLHFVGSAALVKAWRSGDHSVVVGAYFDCWHADMVIRPVELPAHWLRFCSMDWGSYHPFSVGWWAISDGTLKQFPKGAMIRYREWYGVARKHTGDVDPNVGVKLTAEQVGLGVVERTPADERIDYHIADPAMHQQDGGPSIAERIFNATKIAWARADNQRKAGWDQMRSRMIGVDGRPALFVFSNCVDSIRTIPSLQHDKIKAEDVDTDGEDHAGDEWRYACMSRPWTKTIPEAIEDIVARITKPITFADFDEAQKRREHRV